MPFTFERSVAFDAPRAKPARSLRQLVAQTRERNAPAKRVIEAAKALGNSSNPRAVKPLAELLGDKRAIVRTLAINALRRLGFRTALPALITHAGTLHRYGSTEREYNRIKSAISATATPRDVRWLAAKLATGRETERKAVLHALAHVADSRAINALTPLVTLTDTLGNRLNTVQLQDRLDATVALSRVRDKRVTRLLSNEVLKRAPQLKFEPASGTMGQFYDEEDALQAAVTGLARQKDADTIPALLVALDQHAHSAELASNAAHALFATWKAVRHSRAARANPHLQLLNLIFPHLHASRGRLTDSPEMIGAVMSKIQTRTDTRKRLQRTGARLFVAQIRAEHERAK